MNYMEILQDMEIYKSSFYCRIRYMSFHCENKTKQPLLQKYIVS